MLRNLLYVFNYDKAGVRKAIFWEFLHNLCIAIPSMLLLGILWELFDASPNLNRIWGYCIGMLLLFGIQMICAQKAMFASNRTTFEISRKLRIDVGDKLQRLSLGYYKKRDPGELASVILQDVNNFENIFGHSVTNITNALFGTLLLSLFLFILDWRLATTLLGAMLLAVPIVILGRSLVQKIGKPQIQSKKATSARFLEYALGIQHIKSYGMTGTKFRSLDESLDSLRRSSINVEAVPGPIILTAGALFEVFFVLMIWYGILLLSDNQITTNTLVAFLIVGYRLYEPAKILMVEYPVLSYMNISLDRIVDVLEAKEQSHQSAPIPNDFNIKFEQVCFSYIDNKRVLNNISFEAQSGTLTALVGPSGSGKTTITSLIARFWDIDKGEISIGGTNIEHLKPDDVYTLISEVFQEVYLFDDSIYNNIKIGNPEASNEQILQAAKKARVLDFTDHFPNGIDTFVGEGGNKLSGGQKQRISIARALLKDAPIVLMDEATASLDPENEMYIQAAIQELTTNKTVIVIAHKLSTIVNADQILVLNEGTIAEFGTHDTLLMKKGLYAHLWNTQRNVSGWKFKS